MAVVGLWALAVKVPNMAGRSSRCSSRRAEHDGAEQRGTARRNQHSKIHLIVITIHHCPRRPGRAEQPGGKGGHGLEMALAVVRTARRNGAHLRHDYVISTSSLSGLHFVPAWFSFRPCLVSVSALFRSSFAPLVLLWTYGF